MKKLTLLMACLYAFQYASAQNFGKEITAENAIAAKTVSSTLADQESITLKVEGTIDEVCQAKGCWMTMEVGNQQSMRITFKDYGFFVPIESSGQKAVIEGVLKKELISVATLKHLAEDAGKSKAEIAAITEPKSSLVFVADGVLFIN